jgi:hypothetical protein
MMVALIGIVIIVFPGVHLQVCRGVAAGLLPGPPVDEVLLRLRHGFAQVVSRSHTLACTTRRDPTALAEPIACSIITIIGAADARMQGRRYTRHSSRCGHNAATRRHH